jgi:DNA gyrase subunit B
LLFHLVENKVESNELISQDAANAFVTRLGAQFPGYVFTVESHPEEERFTLLIQDKDAKPNDEGQMPDPIRLTAEALDSLEFERLVELRPKVQDYLPGEQNPLLLLVGEKEERQITSLEDLRFFVEERGKKGVQLQRFKGLGEMMPQQLWDTTMNPETRTLLKVEIEEAAVADKLFDILMGERVEPRRHFIESNAASVKNLDV